MALACCCAVKKTLTLALVPVLGAADPPRKRVDAAPLSQLNGQVPRLSLGSLSEGSPVAPRRALVVQQLYVALLLFPQENNNK